MNRYGLSGAGLATHGDLIIVTGGVGKGGILKRLNRGIESLLKMTGPIKLDEKPEDIYSIPGIQITGPLEVAPLKWKVTYAMKYNMNTFKFEDEFDLIDNGQIKTLTRRLLK